MRRLMVSMLSVLDAASSERPLTGAGPTSITIEGLFRDHAEDVHRIVASLLGPGSSRADVEDLTQQVFLKAYRALPEFRGDSKPTTWLYGIASRAVMTYLRGWRRRRKMIEALETELKAPRQREASAEERLASKLELERVWRALLRIKPQKRIVFVLHEIEGLSGKEIAEALEIKEPTVYTRLYHARRELVVLLKESP